MKQNIGTKYWVKLRRESLLLCIMLIVTVFTGCAFFIDEEPSGAKSEETLETLEEPLLIFYDGTGEYLIKSFMSAHPEVNIKLVECMHIGDDGEEDGNDEEGYEDNAEIDMQDIISKNGVPDLIIGGEELSGYLPEWYREGYIVDLGEFCASDVSIDTDDYFPETFEVFRDDPTLYALPLGISMDVMLISESKYYGSTFVNLEDGYTGRELLDVLMSEVQNEREPGEFFSEFNRSPLEWMYYLDGVTQTEDGIQMDEELFKLVYELAYQNTRVQEEARDFWSKQGKMFNGVTGYASPCALDPRRYEGKFIIDMGTLDDAPALVLSYAETAFRYHIEEGVTAIYLPTADNGSKYQAKVKIWGAVAEESKRKEIAYELLRALMDEEINSFGMLRGVSTEDINVYPINKTNAMSLLDRFENQTISLMYENSVITDRVDISNEEKEKHDEMLRNISGLYCWSNELQSATDICKVYFDAHVADYQNCYLDTLNTLNNGGKAEFIPNLSDIGDGDDGTSEVIMIERDETAEAKVLKEKIKNLEVYDTFYFGETEQDNNFENGAEPIEWIILEKKEDKAFVISKNVIEWLTFCEFNDEVTEGGVTTGSKNWFTWKIERNQQRAWLQDQLYENGFTDYEKELIMVTHNVTEDMTISRVWDLESDDYLYIPSKEEIEKSMDIQLRPAEMTAYVAAKSGKSGYCWWTLRNPSEKIGKYADYVLQVTETGEFMDIRTYVPTGVRPVMWLDIS